MVNVILVILCDATIKENLMDMPNQKTIILPPSVEFWRIASHQRYVTNVDMCKPV